MAGAGFWVQSGNSNPVREKLADVLHLKHLGEYQEAQKRNGSEFPLTTRRINRVLDALALACFS